MKKPMTGDVFAFPLKTEVKYGLIQIIEKSRTH